MGGRAALATSGTIAEASCTRASRKLSAAKPSVMGRTRAFGAAFL